MAKIQERHLRLSLRDNKWLVDCLLIEPLTHKDDIIVGTLRYPDESVMEPGETPGYQILMDQTKAILEIWRSDGTLSFNPAVAESPEGSPGESDNQAS